MIHAYLAWSSILTTLCTIALGINAQRNRSSMDNAWNTELVLQRKRAHRIASYTLIVLTQLAMAFALVFKKSVGVDVDVAFWVILEYTTFFGSIALLEWH